MYNATNGSHLAPVLPLPTRRTLSPVDAAVQELSYLAQAAANSPRADRGTLLDATAAVLKDLSPTDLAAVAADLVEQLRDQMITVSSYQAGAAVDLSIPF